MEATTTCLSLEQWVHSPASETLWPPYSLPAAVCTWRFVCVFVFFFRIQVTLTGSPLSRNNFKMTHTLLPNGAMRETEAVRCWKHSSLCRQPVLLPLEDLLQPTRPLQTPEGETRCHAVVTGDPRLQDTCLVPQPGKNARILLYQTSTWASIPLDARFTQFAGAVGDPAHPTLPPGLAALGQFSLVPCWKPNSLLSQLEESWGYGGGSSDGKESAMQETRFNPWVGKMPWLWGGGAATVGEPRTELVSMGMDGGSRCDCQSGKSVWMRGLHWKPT